MVSRHPWWRAKLQPPRLRDDAVPRLFDRVVSSRARITVISGSAGAGKSTLLAQCHSATPCATWLSLDEADNDPVTLLWY